MADAVGADDRLVACPEKEGVHYFVWHCREMQRLGRLPCVGCEAPEMAVDKDAKEGRYEID